MSNAVTNGLSPAFFTVESHSFASLPAITKETVQKTIQAWETIAAERRTRRSSKTKIFSEAESIAQLMDHRLATVTKISNLQLLICKDPSGNIQAMASTFVFRRCIEISDMMTHPHNIDSALNRKEQNRVVGAGKALIDHVKEEMQKGQEIDHILVSSPTSAVKFFEKMGFLRERANTGSPWERAGGAETPEELAYNEMIFSKQPDEQISCSLGNYV